jgi:uncharacterized protein YkwD
MKRYHNFAVVLALAGGPCMGGGPVAPASSSDPAVTEFARLVNEVRHDNGCPGLAWDDRLAEVARRHSADMIERGFFDHVNPSQQSPFDRLKAAGIAYREAAENILYGTTDANHALELWMNSPGHRANILTCSFTLHGVGRVEGHWTHLFIRPPPGG